MEKFNWINGETALNDENLNGMQEGIEKSCVAVSKTQPTTLENVWIKKGKNLFNKNAISSNCYVNKDTGAFVNSEYYSVSDYINVEKLNQITISASSYPDATAPGLCFYDKNKIFIKGQTIPKQAQTITITNDVAFIKISILNNQLDSLQIEQGNTATNYEAYTEKEIYVKNENGVFERFYSENELNKEHYSTSEQKIGTWINGKPLYRKVINCGALPNATTKNIEHGISNPFFTKIYGVSYGTNIFLPLPYVDDVESKNNVLLRAASTGITIRNPIDRDDFAETYVVLEYIKTTD